MFVLDGEECVLEFRQLLKQNRYIPFREYQEFLNRYDDLFRRTDITNEKEELRTIANSGYKLIQKHNQAVIDHQLVLYRDYFDHMFDEIDPSIHLDEEQRRAILDQEDYSLIIAGAGAGKTTTMAAKVKFLVEQRNVSPSKIAVISYTNQATEELEERIRYEFHLPVHVMTFHSLGMQVVRHMFNTPLKPVVEGEQKQIIIDFVKQELFPNPSLLDDYVETFNAYKVGEYPLFSKGFVANYKKFRMFDEYFADYKKRKLAENKDQLLKIVTYRMENYLKDFRTLKNERVKSEAEARIADFLFYNGIPYEYEQPYPERIDQERAYLPDFTIYVDDIPIYIEYYGLSTPTHHGTNTLSKRTFEKYQEIRHKKRVFHKNHHNRYIELDYELEIDGKKLSYLDILKIELAKYHVPMKPRSLEEIYNQILDNNVEAEFFNFVNLMLDIIAKIKANVNRNRYLDKIREFVISQDVPDSLKSTWIHEAKLLSRLYSYYESQILPKSRVDFADMIYYANKYMTSMRDNLSGLEYDYIIIDEYQDISLDRYQFAKNLSVLSNAKVISVGDDWQTIFSFAGSRIDLFYRYSQLFAGSKQLFINHTYRNSQQLINQVGQFIMKNPLQIKKDLISSKRQDHPIRVRYYMDDEFAVLETVIGEIYEQNPNQHILILARRNKRLRDMFESGQFIKGIGTRAVSKKYPNAYIDAMSVHSAKGLGADQVILLHVTDTDFPCIEPERMWLVKLFTPTAFEEEFPDAEERRVFYVALTRTKNQVYLLTPSNIDKQSRFLKELF